MMEEAAPSVHDAIVLVIDDEPANLTLLRRALEREGYVNVHTLDDSRRAVGVFHELDADIVLVDLHMPHRDGYEVMADLRSEADGSTPLPVVVLTADTSPESRRHALAAGATDFLLKPLDLTEVSLRVRNLLELRMLHRRMARYSRVLEERVRSRTQELREANQALREADRVKSEFVSMASHEMRTPLTVVKGFIELLGEHGDDLPPDRRSQLIESMQRNAERLHRLVNELLLAASIESGHRGASSTLTVRPAPVDLAETVASAVADSGLHDDDVSLRCSGDSVADVDPELLGRVLTNLLTNARKYGEPPVEIACGTTAGKVEIVVQDCGPGIDEEFVPQLFERFTQASVGDRRTSSGTGLGMWIARELARLHGGDLVYDPRAGSARFRLTLATAPNAPQH